MEGVMKLILLFYGYQLIWYHVHGMTSKMINSTMMIVTGQLQF